MPTGCGGTARRLSRRASASVFRFALVGGSILLGLGGVWGGPGNEAKTPSAPSSNPSTLAPTLPRLREGTELVDQLGHFEPAGDRIVFVVDGGKARLVVLENLSLERVARTSADSLKTLQWKVSGTVTEYRGSNYLLLSRAVLKLSEDQDKQTSAKSPPQPMDRRGQKLSDDQDKQTSGSSAGGQQSTTDDKRRPLGAGDSKPAHRQ